jgi:hypothetical protein
MSLDPKTVFKKAATRAATATPNLLSGAVTLAASAALWNPLPLLLWGIGSAAWVLYASTSHKYTRRVLDDERQAAEQAADQAREALRAKIEEALARRPFAIWLRAGLLPDYLRVFARLQAVRDRVAQLLAERRDDELAGLGIEGQLTYLLTAFLQFVQARLALLQTLVDFRPGAPAGEGEPPEAAQAAAQDSAFLAAALGAAQGVPVPHEHAVRSGHPPSAAGRAAGRAAYGAPGWQPAAADPGTAAMPAGSAASRGAAGASAPFGPLGPMTPITARTRAVPAGGAAQPGRSGAAPDDRGAGELPRVAALLADLDQRIAGLRQLAQSEPATAHTREWHIGILQKQQELLRDCASRDQQLVAQLTAVPDAFDVIAGRISAAQFDAAELAAYTGGVVEQIEETEKFVRAMRPVADEVLQGTPAAAGTAGTAGATGGAGATGAP